MEHKELICIMCPVGCHLQIDEMLNVTGNKCKRGILYASDEIKAPKRLLTTTVKTVSKVDPRLPVKSEKPIPKDLIFEAMENLNRIIIKKNVKIGDVIIKDICHSHINIIATKNFTL